MWGPLNPSRKPGCCLLLWEPAWEAQVIGNWVVCYIVINTQRILIPQHMLFMFCKVFFLNHPAFLSSQQPCQAGRANLPSLLYKWNDWGPESLRELAQVTQQVKVRATDQHLQPFTAKLMFLALNHTVCFWHCSSVACKLKECPSDCFAEMNGQYLIWILTWHSCQLGFPGVSGLPSKCPAYVSVKGKTETSHVKSIASYGWHCSGGMGGESELCHPSHADRISAEGGGSFILPPFQSCCLNIAAPFN